ncbi:MAG: tRNA (adenosine(37)-N6)-threonylcarbamoyltransferase complex ATPase subunit type 1 TsaE [Myxococcales bacterium]|nr:tRNA (adenosine(37)-N6)-threonylcarbamoyltransferase complex ATPase subunit type 1 TsaE [Myxococcales bacterium]
MTPKPPVEIALPNRRATKALAEKVAPRLRPGDLVRLDGDLGAGKTFFTRALLRALGVGEETAVTSPTFVLVTEYPCKVGLVLHADLYRLREGGPRSQGFLAEVEGLGLRERRDEGAVLVVEWGEGAEAALGGEPELTVTLRVEGTNARRAFVGGPLAAELGGAP